MADLNPHLRRVLERALTENTREGSIPSVLTSFAKDRIAGERAAILAALHRRPECAEGCPPQTVCDTCQQTDRAAGIDASSPPVEGFVLPEVDALAQFIRVIDGKHNLGAGHLAERILAFIAAAAPQKAEATTPAPNAAKGEGGRSLPDAVRVAGAMLANCAFNLAQRSHLTDDERRSLDESRKAWDAALATPQARTGGSNG